MDASRRAQLIEIINILNMEAEKRVSCLSYGENRIALFVMMIDIFTVFLFSIRFTYILNSFEQAVDQEPKTIQHKKLFHTF